MDYASEIILISTISFISLKNDQQEEDEHSYGTVKDVRDSIAYTNNVAATSKMKNRLINMSAANPIGLQSKFLQEQDNLFVQQNADDLLKVDFENKNESPAQGNRGLNYSSLGPSNANNTFENLDSMISEGTT